MAPTASNHKDLCNLLPKSNCCKYTGHLWTSLRQQRIKLITLSCYFFGFSLSHTRKLKCHVYKKNNKTSLMIYPSLLSKIKLMGNCSTTESMLNWFYISCQFILIVLKFFSFKWEPILLSPRRKTIFLLWSCWEAQRIYSASSYMI